MNTSYLKTCMDSVREQEPLVHCVTNYVTVNDCANALLAVGGSPIMSSGEASDVRDIASICDGLDLNIGTLDEVSVGAMRVAATRAGELGHPILLDPVGAGASAMRTSTASVLLDSFPVSVIRGNMSEIQAVAGASSTTHGVDANPDDAVTRDNLADKAAFVRSFSTTCGTIVAVTGAIDLVSDGTRTVAIANGDATMSRITGSGCMLSAITPAFLAAHDDAFEAAVTAVCAMGVAGEVAAGRMGPLDGNGSFRTYLLDALYNLTGDSLLAGAHIDELEV